MSRHREKACKAEKKLHVGDFIQTCVLNQNLFLLGADRLRNWERRGLIFLLLSNLQRFGENCCTGKPRQHTGKYTLRKIKCFSMEFKSIPYLSLRSGSSSDQSHETYPETSYLNKRWKDVTDAIQSTTPFSTFSATNVTHMLVFPRC